MKTNNKYSHLYVRDICQPKSFYILNVKESLLGNELLTFHQNSSLCYRYTKLIKHVIFYLIKLQKGSFLNYLSVWIRIDFFFPIFFRLTWLRVKESHSRFKVMKRWNPQKKKSSNMTLCFTIGRIEILLTFNCLQLFIVTCVYTWYIIYNMYIQDMINFFFLYSNITKFILW